MAPAPFPSPLPAWSKGIIYAGSPLGGFLWDLLTYEKAAPTTMQWRKLMCKFTNNGTGAVAADAAYCSFDIVNVTSGNVDNSWTTGDYTTCEALFDTFWNVVKASQSTWTTMNEYRWYTREFTDITAPKPFKDSGPPQRVTIKSIPGIQGGGTPAQLAMAVTEKTPWPKHWGRFYIPNMDPATSLSQNRFGTTRIDTVATGAAALYAGLGNAEFYPVVPVTQVAKAPARALVTVNQIQIDDVPDIVRRRRPHATLYRKVLP